MVGGDAAGLVRGFWRTGVSNMGGDSVVAGTLRLSSHSATLWGMASTAAAVRKTVTVLFCDLAGSTELGERLDPEALRTLMGRWYAAMRDPVERHGGTVEKFVGDAVLAVFGVPQLHEDDALRAVRAAVEMRT